MPWPPSDSPSRDEAPRRPGPGAAPGQARAARAGGRGFERLLADPALRDALAKIGATPDALLAERGWSLVDAAKPAEADRVFARLLKDYPESPHAADARFNLAESANQARNYAEVIRLLSPLAASRPARARRPAGPAGPRGRREPRDGTRPAACRPSCIGWDGRRSSSGTGRPPRRLSTGCWRSSPRTPIVEKPASCGPSRPWRWETPQRPSPASPRSWPSRRGRAMPRASAGRPPEADPVLGGPEALEGRAPGGPGASFRAEARRPGRGGAGLRAGQAQMGLGRLEEARTAFQAVIDARRGGELAAQAQLMRGETFFHEDRLREALREFLRVDILYNAPRWQAAALLEAGKVYERLDQWADAAETYDRLVARFPKDRDAATARSRGESARQRAAGRAAVAPVRRGVPRRESRRERTSRSFRDSRVATDGSSSPRTGRSEVDAHGQRPGFAWKDPTMTRRKRSGVSDRAAGRRHFRTLPHRSSRSGLADDPAQARAEERGVASVESTGRPLRSRRVYDGLVRPSRSGAWGAG